MTSVSVTQELETQSGGRRKEKAQSSREQYLDITLNKSCFADIVIKEEVLRVFLTVIDTTDYKDVV